MTTNDAYYVSGDQWGLNGTYGINAPQAWEYSTGDCNLLVGILDTGIDGDHPDLSDNMSYNLHRDYIDCPPGYSYIDVAKADLEDPNGHGTHIAGIIGAVSNNAGVSGIARELRMVSIRVGDENGTFYLNVVDLAIDYANDALIQILNYSAGSSNNYYQLYLALQNYAGLFVCAAGNYDKNNDLNDHYPSNYNLPNLISVGAIKSDGQRPTVSDWGYYDEPTNTIPTGSNYGLTTVDIFAPGDNILSTFPISKWGTTIEGYEQESQGYAYASGTSMATPFVTGVAALMLSANNNLTPQQIKSTIMNNATKYSSIFYSCVCGGRLDAFKTLASVALDYDLVNDDIIIEGFSNEYTPPLNMKLEIPIEFAPLSSTYLGSSQKSVKVIGNEAFAGCSNVKSIALPSSIENIGDYAFMYCINIEDISFGGNSNLISIGADAFYYCNSLVHVEVPTTVLSLGQSAFRYCTSLEEVTIKREQYPTTTLGVFAFTDCTNQNFHIKVPTNRVAEYKNEPFWSSYKNKIVPINNITSTIDLDCMSDFSQNTYLNAGYNKIYKLDVDCSGSYTIAVSSGSHINIYDSTMTIIETTNTTCDISLNEGIYYIDVEFLDDEEYGYNTISFLNKGKIINSASNNILPHLHEVDINEYKARLRYYHTRGAGFFQFTLNAVPIGNTSIDYDLGAITLYTNYNRTSVMKKYNCGAYSLDAKTEDNINNMVVFLPDDGYYYLDVNMNTDDLYSLTLNVTTLSNEEVNLFNMNQSSNTYLQSFESCSIGDQFKKITLNQTGKFEIVMEYGGADVNDIICVCAELIYNSSTNTYYINQKSSSVLCYDNIYNCDIVILEPGIYYVGYFNKKDNAEVSVSLERKITQYGSYHLITDPDSNTECGSEVRYNNGDYLGTTVTIGFTRFIYLDDPHTTPSLSRLNYYWYSSNESIATITEYGTLLGKSSGTVKIMAVYKNDPSITYVKEFTILSDNRVNNLIIYDMDNVIYTGSGQLYQIELDDENSFFPQVTLYNWELYSSSNNYSYQISMWGTFYLVGPDVIIVEGTSSLNSKLKIRIIITVVC